MVEVETQKQKIDRQVFSIVCIFAWASGLLYTISIDYTKYPFIFGMVKGLVTFVMGYGGIIKTFEYLLKLTGGET